MADEVELLFKLRADPSGVAAGTKEAKAELLQLRDVFASQLGRLQSRGLELLEVQLTNITDKVPVLGSALSEVTGNLFDLGKRSDAVKELNDNLSKIADASGRSVAEVALFVDEIAELKDAGAVANSVFSFLGENLANRLLPTLELAAKANQTFGDQLLEAGLAAGKSEAEINEFVNRLVSAEDRTSAFAEIVGFLGEQTATKLAPAMDAASESIQKIATLSNLPTAAVSQFVSEFGKLEDAVQKSKAATEFFGEAVAKKVEPELNAAAKAMTGAVGASTRFATSLAAVVTAIGPVGLAIVGLVVQLGLLAVAFTALVGIGKEIINRFLDMAKSAADFRGKLFDLSQQTGVTVEVLSAFEIVANTTGGSIQGLVASLIFFQRQIEAAKDPTSDTAAVFRELGITSTDTNTALKQSLAGLFALGEGSRQTTLALQLFGRSSRSILAILKESHGDLDAVIKKAKEFGILISTEDAQAADKFNDALEILNLQIRALVGKESIPAAIELLENVSKTLNENKEAFDNIGKVIRTFSQGIGLLTTSLLTLVGILGSTLNRTMELLNFQFGNSIRLFSAAAIALGILGDAGKKSKEGIEGAAKATDALVLEQQRLRKAAEDRVKAGEAELGFLQALSANSELLKDFQQQLAQSYRSLDEPTRIRIQRIGDERQQLEALIEVKKRKLEQDKEEARAPVGVQQRNLRQEIADTEALAASRKFALDATLQAAKQEQEAADQDFKAGKIRRDEKLAADRKYAAESLAVEIRRVEESRALNIKKHQDLLRSGKQGTEDEQKLLDKGRELDQKRFDAEQNYRDELKRLDHQFKLEEIEAEKRHQENKVNIFRQKASNRISEIRDELATGSSVRKALLEAEEREIELQQTRISRTSLEEALKRSDLQLEVRELFTKNLAVVISKQTQLEEQSARDRINILLTAGKEAALLAEDEIKKQEDAVIRKRRIRLEEDLASTVNVRERERIKDDLDALQVEQTEVERQQSVRRREIVQNEERTRAAIITSQADTTVQLIERTERSITDTIQRQVDLRLITEETAAAKITKLRLDALRTQEDLIRAQQTAAVLIKDPFERAQREAELNDALKVLQQQRKEIIEQGNADIQDARTKDLDNERRYQEELSRLQGRLFTAQRDAIKAVISILGGDTRRRRELARAELELEAAEEQERHRVIKENTDKEISLRKERLQFIEQHLKTLRLLGKQETEEFKDTNARRAEVLSELELLYARQEAEETRHVAAMNVTARAMLESGLFTKAEILRQLDIEKGLEELRHRRALEALEKRKAELEKVKELNDKQLEELKRINAAIEAERDRHKNKTEQQNQDQKKAEQSVFKDILEEFLEESPIKKEGDAIRELGKISIDAFKGMANAIGGVVEAWVLYGKTGPAVLRKVLAAALAAVSAEATVKAIMELAYGFAALALGDPRAALHFKAAALFGAVAVIAGVGGRALAGNSFNQGAGAGAGAGGGAGQTRTETPPRPIDLERQQSTTQIHLFLHAEPGPGFNDQVVRGVINNIRTNGEMRDIIVHTAGDA